MEFKSTHIFDQLLLISSGKWLVFMEWSPNLKVSLISGSNPFSPAVCGNTWWWVLQCDVCSSLTSASRSTAGRELATRTGAHVGSGTEAIATRIPANSWEERKGRYAVSQLARSCYDVCGLTWWHKTSSHAFSSLQEKRYLRTIHWFPPGRVFQPGQQYEWKREPHTLGLMETRKKEQTNLLVTQTSQTYSCKSPKQIDNAASAFLSLPGTCRASAFRINKTNFDTKPLQVMDRGIFKEGRRGRKCEGGQQHEEQHFVFTEGWI